MNGSPEASTSGKSMGRLPGLPSRILTAAGFLTLMGCRQVGFDRREDSPDRTELAAGYSALSQGVSGRRGITCSRHHGALMKGPVRSRTRAVDFFRHAPRSISGSPWLTRGPAPGWLPAPLGSIKSFPFTFHYLYLRAESGFSEGSRPEYGGRCRRHTEIATRTIFCDGRPFSWPGVCGCRGGESAMIGFHRIIGTVAPQSLQSLPRSKHLPAGR